MFEYTFYPFSETFLVDEFHTSHTFTRRY